MKPLPGAVFTHAALPARPGCRWPVGDQLQSTASSTKGRPVGTELGALLGFTHARSAVRCTAEWLQPSVNYPSKKVKFSCFPWPKQELSPQGLRSGFEVPLPARHKHLRVISSGGRTAVEGEPPDTGSSHISTCSRQQATYHSIQINYPRGRFYKNFLDTATQSAHV